jgi:hypothetical protein
VEASEERLDEEPTFEKAEDNQDNWHGAIAKIIRPGGRPPGQTSRRGSNAGKCQDTGKQRDSRGKCWRRERNP